MKTKEELQTMIDNLFVAGERLLYVDAGDKDLIKTLKGVDKVINYLWEQIRLTDEA